MTLFRSALRVANAVFTGASSASMDYLGVDVCIFRGDMRIPAQHEPCGSLISGI